MTEKSALSRIFESGLFFRNLERLMILKRHTKRSSMKIIAT